MFYYKIITICLIIILLEFHIIIGTPIIKGADTSQINQYGQDTSYPYMAFIEITFKPNQIDNYNTFGCGGVVIQLDCILTAAHCLEKVNKRIIKEIKITVGTKYYKKEDNKRDPGVQYAKGKSYKVHKDYQDELKKWYGSRYYRPNDIALIWLEDNLKLTDYVKVADISTDYLKLDYRNGEVIGWGTDENGCTPKKLKKVKLNILTQSECQNALKDIKISDKIFCAISENRDCGTSLGDSGGPFIIDDKIVGLVSFGKTRKIQRDDNECTLIGNTQLPAVFTNLYEYRKWIGNSLNKGSSKIQCQNEYSKFCLI